MQNTKKTENFSDLRNNLMHDSNLKKKQEAVAKIAKFKSTEEVEGVINGMKNNVSDKDFEQLLLACIEVYGSLKDITSANTFFAKLTTDKSKVRAYVLMGNLKEAYILAAKTNSNEDVRMVLMEARNSNDNRVITLCQQFLGTGADNNIELKVV